MGTADVTALDKRLALSPSRGRTQPRRSESGYRQDPRGSPRLCRRAIAVLFSEGRPVSDTGKDPRPLETDRRRDRLSSTIHPGRRGQRQETHAIDRAGSRRRSGPTGQFAGPARNRSRRQSQGVDRAAQEHPTLVRWRHRADAVARAVGRNHGLPSACFLHRQNLNRPPNRQSLACGVVATIEAHGGMPCWRSPHTLENKRVGSQLT